MIGDLPGAHVRARAEGVHGAVGRRHASHAARCSCSYPCTSKTALEFYDLVIKRGVLLLLSLAIWPWSSLGRQPRVDRSDAGRHGAALALRRRSCCRSRCSLPWLHDRSRTPSRSPLVRTRVHAGRGRQTRARRACSRRPTKRSLVAATESTLSEMFRRPIVIVLADQAAARERRGHRGCALPRHPTNACSSSSSTNRGRGRC